MKNKVLFITEKWCDALPEKGLTNNFHNLFGTFRNNNPDIPFNLLHLDECAAKLKIHIDGVIPKVVDKIQPNIVIFSLLGKSSLNPSSYSYQYLKNKDCKLVFMWPDIGLDWGIPQIKHELKPFADLHVTWGGESNIQENNLLSLWAPQDENLYNPISETEKDINCSFIGSTRYHERQLYLKYLLDNKIDILIDGGQREKGLTPKQYSNLIQRTKINLNFPFCPSGFDQIKGRVFEVLATRSFLLERKNSITSKYFEAGKDYIEFENEKDLVNKIKYFSHNSQERVMIQTNAYNTYINKYSSKIFWNKVMSHLGVL